MLNKCCFIGHLGRDPEIRSTQSGDKVANLSLGVTESWKKDGERKERTEWVRIVVFGSLCDVIEKYVHKGSKLYIEGKLQTRKWQNKDGQDQYTTEVVLQGFGAMMVMLDGKPDNSGDEKPPKQQRKIQDEDDLDPPF